jgi:hypothetical protein
MVTAMRRSAVPRLSVVIPLRGEGPTVTRDHDVTRTSDAGLLSLRDRPRRSEPVGGSLMSPAPVGSEVDTLGNVHRATFTRHGERLALNSRRDMVGGTPVRNPDRTSYRSSVRTLRSSAAVAALTIAALVGGQGTAAAVQAEPNAMTFGLLGPVGLIAVVIGVLGMIAGALRQRKKNRLAAAEAESVATVAPVDAIPEPSVVPAAAAVAD